MPPPASKPSRNTPRREDALSRERIIEAAVALLDDSGEAGLTFRALSEHLTTGPGAIYWHIANKSELLTAACDAIVARALTTSPANPTPAETLRTLALGLFDAIDDHPWAGSALMQSPGQPPMLRILERIGQQVRALGVPLAQQWAATSALLHYILGVAGQNAANAQRAQAHSLDRDEMLTGLSATWAALDPAEFPFASSMAAALQSHDDRADFLAGVDLILAGLAPSRRR